MRTTRRAFLVLAGLAAMDAALEVHRLGLVSFVAPGISNRLRPPRKSIAPNIDPQVLSDVYGAFDPSVQEYLISVPIVTSSAARTAYSGNDEWASGSGESSRFVAVSPDFCSKAGDSAYWADYYSKPPYEMCCDDPVFTKAFQEQLLIHEFLHVVQGQAGLDNEGFFNSVESWYRDDSYGRPLAAPGSGCNWVKYNLWWNLYGKPGDPAEPADRQWKAMEYCDAYRDSSPGVEEFAYIGDSFLTPEAAGSRRQMLCGLSTPVFSSYQGVVNPDILALRSA
jgi:hypothetical protein